MDYKDMTAIGIVRLMLTDGVITEEIAGKYFPELKESEDKKARRMLREIVLQWKNGHQTWCSDDKEIDTILTWLEKPGEQWKPTGAQLASLEIACDRNDSVGFNLTQLLKELKKLI